MRHVLSRLSGFSVAVLVPAAVGFAVIPILIRVAGSSEWSAIAVGQSAGTIAGIVVALGWGFNGPTIVAMTPADGRVAIAVNSLIARAITAPVVIGLACAVAAVLQRDDVWVSTLSCLGVSILGLGMTWLFIGAQDVRSLLLYDALPRAASSVAGIAALLHTRDALAFVFCQLVGAVVSVVLSARVCTRGMDSVRDDWSAREALRQSRKQAFAGITVLTASTYLSMPTLIVAALAPGSVFVYAIADRLTRFTFLAIAPIYQWMQGWVPSDPVSTETLRRIRLVLQSSAILAVVLATLTIVAGPAAARLLGDEAGLLTWTLTVPLGISVAMSAMSRCSGMVCLLALGRDRTVAVSAVLGACCGVPLLLVLVPWAGAVGAAVAVLISETVVTAFQAVRLRQVVRTVREQVHAC